jgi:hypothetical protein
LFHCIVWVKDLPEKGWFEETGNFTFTHDLTADLTLEMDKDISFSRFLVGRKKQSWDNKSRDLWECYRIGCSDHVKQQ